MGKKTERFPLHSPILLGVAGYTRLHSDQAPVREAVKQTLQTLVFEAGLKTRKFPNTPFLLVSSLAEGADQLCCDIALELGLEVYVPLPFPPELYATRFKQDSKAAERLRQLCAHENVHWFCPPLADDLGPSFEAVIVNDKLRARRYADVAIFVARHSHLMLFLSEGTASDTSLTAQLLSFKVHGKIPSVVNPMTTPPELGIAYHIFTPRPDWKPDASGPRPGTVTVLPEPKPNVHDHDRQVTPQALFEQTCCLTEELNAEIARAQPSPPLNDLSPSGTECTAGETHLVAFRRLVAKLSYPYKTKIDWSYRIVFTLVFIGALLFQFYGDDAELVDGKMLKTSWLYYLSAGFFAVAWLYPKLVRMPTLERRRLDYRALAEALRVQYYWHHAGLNEWVPDHYLRRQRSELDWIRQATRAWALRLQADHPPAGKLDPARFKDICHDWLRHQETFFGRSHQTNEQACARLRTSSRVCLVSAAALAALLIWPFSAAAPPQWFLSYLIFMSILLLIAAMTSAYAEKRLYAEHARHFAAMKNLFGTAAAQSENLLADGRHDIVAALLLEMGKEALDENTDWLILHRVRNFEVPM